MKKKIIVLISSYYPDVNSLKKLIHEFSHCDVYLTDNSNNEIVTNKLIKLQKKYLFNLVINNSNYGISKAFNNILSKIKKKYDYIIFFDQDSFIEFSNIKKLINSYELIDDKNKISITPVCKTYNVIRFPFISFKNLFFYSDKGIKNKITNVAFSILSSSIFDFKKLQNAKLPNGDFFHYDFFVDGCDLELSFRLKFYNYNLYCDKSIQFLHNLGIKSIKLLANNYSIHHSSRYTLRIGALKKLSKLTYVPKLYSFQFYIKMFFLLLILLIIDKPKMAYLRNIYSLFFYDSKK